MRKNMSGLHALNRLDILRLHAYNMFVLFDERNRSMSADDFMSVSQAAERWDVTIRWVQTLCLEGRIDGAFRIGRAWIIPRKSEKPVDARIKSGKYIKKKDSDR